MLKLAVYVNNHSILNEMLIDIIGNLLINLVDYVEVQSVDNVREKRLMLRDLAIFVF